MRVEVCVDFCGAGEGGEAVDGLRRMAVAIVVVAEAAAGRLQSSRVGIGGFGEALGGFVQVSTEVTDGGCAGVGPDAAAEGDVFEDFDTLVGESGGVVSFTFYRSASDNMVACLLAFCLGSSPSIAAYVAMKALCQAAHVNDGHSSGVEFSGCTASVKYLCIMPIMALDAPMQLCRAAL